MLDNTFVRQTEQLHSRQIIAAGHKRFSNNGAKYVEGNGGTTSASSPNQPTNPAYLSSTRFATSSGAVINSGGIGQRRSNIDNLVTTPPHAESHKWLLFGTGVSIISTINIKINNTINRTNCRLRRGTWAWGRHRAWPRGRQQFPRM